MKKMNRNFSSKLLCLILSLIGSVSIPHIASPSTSRNNKCTPQPCFNTSIQPKPNPVKGGQIPSELVILWESYKAQMKKDIEYFNQDAGNIFENEKHFLYPVSANGRVENDASLGLTAGELFGRKEFNPKFMASCKMDFVEHDATTGVITVYLPKEFTTQVGDYYTSPALADALNWLNGDKGRSLTLNFDTAPPPAVFEVISGAVSFLCVKSMK